MRNARAIATLGIGFGALAIASLGFVVPAPVDAAPLVVERHAAGGGDIARPIRRESGGNADVSLFRFNAPQQAWTPAPKAEKFTPEHIKSQTAAARFAPQTEAIADIQRKIGAAKASLHEQLRQAQAEQSALERIKAEAQQEQDDEEAFLAMLMAD